MSSALVMVLMAAMAVPGNGPEKVAGEVKQELDMNGRWEGTFLNVGGIMWKTVIEDGKERDYDRESPCSSPPSCDGL